VDDTRAYSQTEADAGTPRLLHGLLLYAPMILAANLIGVSLRYPELGSAILFPGYAVLTAAMVASPRREWIWYILIGVFAHTATSVGHWPVSWILFADVANVTRALVAAFLIQRLLGRQPRLDSVPSLLLFVSIAAIVAPAIGAAIGAWNAVLHDPSQSYGRTWNAWFVSNSLTARPRHRWIVNGQEIL